jgi:hypothetical protein
LSERLFDQTPGGAAAKGLLPILLFARRSFPCIITSFRESSANTDTEILMPARNGIGAERNKGIFGFGSLSDCALPARRTHLLEVFDFCSLRVSSPTAPCLCICRHASPDVCVIYACVCVGAARNSGGLLSRSLFGGLTHARVRF